MGMEAQQGEMIKLLRAYMKKMLELGGSDLHIKSESLIRARIKGDITPLSKSKLPKEKGVQLAKELLGPRFERFVKEKSADFMFKLNADYRFRANLFFQIEGVSGVFRKIPSKLPTIEDMNLPEALFDLCNKARGLVLVTGPTGSGKSTTLASMINYINKTKKKHIITVEDPVEFVHPDYQSIINQRAIGEDAVDFSSSLRAALREDPDIILIGEMRDMETIEMAMHAAETGHLVFSTLHTVDAKETINRIIGMFPGNEQNKIRMSLASVLQGVLSQRLIKTISGGRVAAIEILINTARIQTLIAEARDSEIPEALEEGKKIYKTQSFDQALFDHYKNGLISKEETLWNATNPSDLKMKIEHYEAKKSGEQEKSADDDLIDLKLDGEEENREE